jgi:hypothetical protein
MAAISINLDQCTVSYQQKGNRETQTQKLNANYPPQPEIARVNRIQNAMPQTQRERFDKNKRS